MITAYIHTLKYKRKRSELYDLQPAVDWAAFPQVFGHPITWILFQAVAEAAFSRICLSPVPWLPVLLLKNVSCTLVGWRSKFELLVTTRVEREGENRFHHPNNFIFHCAYLRLFPYDSTSSCTFKWTLVTINQVTWIKVEYMGKWR